LRLGNQHKQIQVQAVAVVVMVLAVVQAVQA
jgi:hypothetical protein